MKLEALLIFPWAGPYPNPIDPDNPALEEQAAIDAWQVIKTNNTGLKAKIDKAENWLFSGEFKEIVDPEKGVKVTKAGLFGIAVSFPLNWIQKPDPETWFTNKVAALRAAGWELRGWATDDWKAELATKGYAFVTGEV